MAGSGWKGNIKLEWLGLGQVGSQMSSQHGSIKLEWLGQVGTAMSGKIGWIS